MNFILLTFLFSVSALSATDPYWHKLLHYRKSSLGKYVSQVDSPGFFISPEGKQSPQKELQASIDILNSDRAQDFVCKFPLRYKWLKKNVNNSWNYTTESCSIYNSFVQKLDAKNLSLVFSSFFVNNPGSTFGHTFIHVSRYKEFRTNELLDYAINFAAEDSKDFVALYMLKGLMGYYPGKFSVVPYYYKIREYNDHEFRDIWDYDLNLNQEQIDRVIDHVWEMGTAYFDYFYFTENCSYHILGLLNVAYDDIDLLDYLPSLYVLPIDTVKEMQKLGLIKQKKVRGSAYAKLLKETENLSNDELRKVRMLAEDPSRAEQLLPQDHKKAADLLDASLSAMDYLKAEAILTAQKKETEEREKLLRLRAVNPVISEGLVFDEKSIPAPDESHGSSRLGFSLGDRLEHGPFSLIEWRAAQHDLLDPSHGQLKYSGITMFETKLRFQQIQFEDHKFVLDRFRLIDFKKYQASDFWNKSISWDLGIGLDQNRDCRSQDCLMPNMTFGVGNSVLFTDDHVLTFLLGGSYQYDQIYQNNSLLQLGPKLNFLILKDQFSLGLDSGYFLPTQLTDGWLQRRIDYNLDFRYFMNRQMALFLKSMNSDFRSTRHHEGQFGVYFYH